MSRAGKRRGGVRSYALVMALNKPVVFGILGGLAWFALGVLVGHYLWT